ncbi:MAG: NADPH-dependent FMN reductase [Pseudobdellovibrionaceae bacterium]
MKILLMAGSLRKGSYNKKLIAVADEILKKKTKAETLVVDMKAHALPVYDGDLEEQSGIPDNVIKWGQLIAGCDAFVLSTPEYNASIPGALKNWIDWTSRLKPHPWPGKQVLLLGASPGALGATRSLWTSRVPLEQLGAHLYPEMLGLPKAADAFEDSGFTLKDTKMQARLETLLLAFVTYAERNSV